ncbi:sensor histidine kinase [Streptomyces litchfieldiae]|uniref:histidine kinase n=1 Tax=Streptomyces litchfieldiae TaxID=3075543 RepID=A0ABU2MNZ0_9ACTN|nr:histidine kinase [Streptomyces sp. DSM 44938]MDT0343341.1 histidine kinase [Streptomyces sp. DSM 44938]
MSDTGASETWEHRWLLPGELLSAGERRPASGARSGRAPRRTGRDWVVDTVAFGFAVLLWAALLPVVEEADYLPRWIVLLDPPLGALACVAVWWRRRHPLLLALGLLPVATISTTFFGALSVALLNLGLRVPLRTGLLVVLAHLAASAPYMLAYTVPDEGGWSTVAFIAAYMLFLFTWGIGMRVRRELVLRLRADAQRERADHARRLADARRTEREAIAREMHDVLAHRISLLSVHSGALAYRTDSATGGAKPLTVQEISDSAQLIRDTAHQALEELRGVLTVLRGTGAAEGAPQPGIEDIEALVAEAARAGQRVTLTHDHDARAAAALRRPVQRTAYRVVQEGLTNARKHAPDAPVTVSLAGAPGRGLTVTVRNPLASGTAAAGAEIPGAGAGLAGLEERAALDGGTLRHGADGATFELVAELPWDPAG